MKGKIVVHERVTRPPPPPLPPSALVDGPRQPLAL